MVLFSWYSMFLYDLRSGSSHGDSHTVQDLKRIEVIADDEEEIMEAVKRMSDRYDFVVTRYLLASLQYLSRQ